MEGPQPRRTASRGTRCAFAALCNVADRLRRPSDAAASAVPSIPRTSPERLAQAAEDADIDTAPVPRRTYLYLAYGSNLCAETFLGKRGIRPLSQVNVSVPTLRLTFNLPGLPYWEPAFANVDWRKLPDKPKLPDPSHPPKIPPIPPPPSTESVWDEGLIGVVYEVTEEDYTTIIKTEGGGASYKEVAVPCIPIPPRMSVPEKPPIPELPRPFLAKTLFAPYIPPGTKLPDDPRKDKWWFKYVIGPYRPNPDYAQPSARYLKLLNDGAREHELPDNYQEYMASLQPYTITTVRQTIGKILFFLFWAPIFLPFMAFAILFPHRGKNGTLPPWLAVTMTVLFNLIWTSYDKFFKPTFGDGERTQEKKKSENGGWRTNCGTDEEKQGLLQEHD